MKKAFIMDISLDFIIIAAYFVFLLVFYIIFTVGADEIQGSIGDDTVIQQSEKVYGNIVINNIMRNEVNINNNYVTFSDMVMVASNLNDYICRSDFSSKPEFCDFLLNSIYLSEGEHITAGKLFVMEFGPLDPAYTLRSDYKLIDSNGKLNFIDVEANIKK